LVDEQNQEHLFEGRCEGKIASSGSGVGGFGYDPVFIPLGFSQSMAVLSAEEKNAISHRGRAMASLKKFLLDSN
jgi:XTP/dITP diphosphohydrolase